MYKVVDILKIYEDRILTEKEVRDIYKESLKEMFFNWLDYNGEDKDKIFNGFMEELASAYTCNMQLVIDSLKESMQYIVEKVKE